MPRQQPETKNLVIPSLHLKGRALSMEAIAKLSQSGDLPINGRLVMVCSPGAAELSSDWTHQDVITSHLVWLGVSEPEPVKKLMTLFRQSWKFAWPDLELMEGELTIQFKTAPRICNTDKWWRLDYDVELSDEPLDRSLYADFIKLLSPIFKLRAGYEISWPRLVYTVDAFREELQLGYMVVYPSGTESEIELVGLNGSSKVAFVEVPEDSPELERFKGITEEYMIEVKPGFYRPLKAVKELLHQAPGFLEDVIYDISGGRRKVSRYTSDYFHSKPIKYVEVGRDLELTVYYDDKRIQPLGRKLSVDRRLITRGFVPVSSEDRLLLNIDESVNQEEGVLDHEQGP